MPSVIEEDFAEVLTHYRAQHPGISERDALWSLWHHGHLNNETFRVFNEVRAVIEYEEHNVWKHPDRFAGWHVGWAREYKPGVLKFFAMRSVRGGWEQREGYCSPDALRVAIETGVIEKPNGYTLP